MKRYIALLLTIVCVLALAGCGSHTEKDYPAAIMAEGEIYLKSVTVMPEEVRGMTCDPMPRISDMLNMFDPMIFPSAI